MFGTALLITLLATRTQPIDLDREVIYEANLRAMAPGHNFAALESRLDTLQRIGVTTVWLMPIYPVGKERSAGGLGSPYAVADYEAVNPDFGSRAQFRALVADCHKRGMKVILDWVANHTAWDNPWVKRHKDWYTQDSQGNITIPAGTNWQDVADLNYDSRPMRRAMVAAMKSWLKEGVDGFRCDYADGVPVDFWKDAISELRAGGKPLLFLAEGAQPGLYDAGFDLTYDWRLYGLVKDIFLGKKSAKEFVPALNRHGKPALRFVTNHDEYAWAGSPAELFGGADAARAATHLVLGAPGGAALVVTGQEAEFAKKIPFFTTSDDGLSATAPGLEGLETFAKLHRKLGAEGRMTDMSTDTLVHFVVRTGAESVEFVSNPKPYPQTWREGQPPVPAMTTLARPVAH